MLYGTTYYGGSNGLGTVFQLNRDGSGYAQLWSFGATASDGQNPPAALIQCSGGALYGTTEAGGTNGLGTVFKLNPDGSGYTQLHIFGGGPGDGDTPEAGLLQGSDGALYGTTYYGGSYGAGAAFRLSLDGVSFAVLRSFGATHDDAWNPGSSLVKGCDGALYSTTEAGGPDEVGTVYKLNEDGSGYAVFLSFSTASGAGQVPEGPLLAGSDGALYGTTFFGGSRGDGSMFSGDGAVFKLASTTSWTFDPPTAFDTCSGANVSLTVLSTVTNGVCPRMFTRTWLATDACGNTNTCSQTVTVADTTPPMITCASNKTVTSGAAWSFDPPIASDTCSGTNVTITILSTVTNGCCPQLLTRTWLVTDACHNTNLCSQTVTLPWASYTVNLVAGLNLIANQLDQGGNTLNEIMPNVPDGSVVYKYNNVPGTWAVSYYSAADSWNPGTITLNPGEGAFFQSPTNCIVIFIGTPHVPVLPRPIANGAIYLLSRQTNDIGNYTNIVGVAPTNGATVYRWSGSSYNSYSFASGAWTPSEPAAAVGEAVWITPSAGVPPPIPKYKADNTIPLDQAASWLNQAVPGSTEFGVWNATVAAPNTTNSLSASMTWGGIKILNPGGPVTLTSGNTLTLNGVAGTSIDMSSAAQDLTLNCAVALASNQTWSVQSSRTLTVGGAIGGLGGLTKSGDGTLLLNGANTYAGGTTVSNGTLSGNGIIAGPVSVQAGATLSPGIGIGWIGRLAINNTLSLAGTTVMDLNKAAGTNDQVGGMTTVAYGGTLVVTNLAGTLAAGDSFKLFDAAHYTGAFAAISPASPGIGITWDMSYLPADGTLRVTTSTTCVTFEGLQHCALGNAVLIVYSN